MTLPPERWITIQHRIREYSEVQQCKEDPVTTPPSNHIISIEDYERLKNLRDLLLSQALTANDHDRIINELYYGNECSTDNDNISKFKPLLPQFPRNPIDLQHKIERIYYSTFSDTKSQHQHLNSTGMISNGLPIDDEVIVGGIDMTQIPFSAIKDLYNYLHEQQQNSQELSSTTNTKGKTIKFQHPTDPRLYNVDLLQIDKHVLLAENDVEVFLDKLTPGEVSIFAIVNISLISYPSNKLITNYVTTARLNAPYISSFFAFKEAPPVIGALLSLYLDQISYTDIPTSSEHVGRESLCAKRGPLVSIKNDLLSTNQQQNRFVFPDVIITDSNGTLHQYRAGLAVHIGCLLGIPTFGVAKNGYNDDTNIMHRIHNTILPQPLITTSKYCPFHNNIKNQYDNDDDASQIIQNYLTTNARNMVDLLATSAYIDRCGTSSGSKIDEIIAIQNEHYGTNYNNVVNEVVEMMNVLFPADITFLPTCALPTDIDSSVLHDDEHQPAQIKFKHIPFIPLISFPHDTTKQHMGLRGVAADASALYRLSSFYSNAKERKKIIQQYELHKEKTSINDTGNIIPLPEINPIFISQGTPQLLSLTHCIMLTYIASCGNKVPTVTTEADHCSRNLTTFFVNAARNRQYLNLLLKDNTNYTVYPSSKT